MTMDDARKTKGDLLAEVAHLRLQVAELQEREAAYRFAKEALQTAKEYADALIRSSLDMIIAVDIQRNIMEFNAAAERTFGMHPDDLVGRNLLDLWGEADRERLAAFLAEVAATRGRSIGPVASSSSPICRSPDTPRPSPSVT